MARVLALGEELANLGKQEQSPSSAPTIPTPPKAEVVRLPVWPDAARAMPNCILRSALFGAIRRGPRRFLQAEPIAAIDGIEIRYTGPRLDQNDLTVYEILLHIQREHDLGREIRVRAYELLKRTGKVDTGGNREVLYESLMRLGATMVDVVIGSKSYAGSLVDEVSQDKNTREYAIILNHKLRPLFDRDQYTLIDWQIRQALNGHQLAQWLHGFYSSHAKPLPMNIETLHRLCGSEAVLLSDFAKKLRKALDAVTEACKVNGEVFKHEICGNLVRVEKKASASQQRHLIKRTTKSKQPRK